METVEVGTFNCSQPECSILSTGKCVNGLPPRDCPNKITILKDDPQSNNGISPETKELEIVRLKWGDTFSEEDVSYITYRYPFKLILLIGEPSCGKSTLYAALFDSFHKGGCGNYFFAATRTPIGFERICHYAREKCKGRESDTERTKSNEFTYLHLAVREKTLKTEIEHILFADVNGERFQLAKDSDEDTRKLDVIKRADQIAFIADGALLLDSGLRHVVKRDVWKMIDRCLQNSMINDVQGVTLIVTKWDKISAAGKTIEVTDFFIIPTLSRYGLIQNVVKVASRSLNEEVPPRTGLDEFLTICLKKNQPSGNKGYIPVLDREFQKFKYAER
jgi:hypothetical protein